MLNRQMKSRAAERQKGRLMRRQPKAQTLAPLAGNRGFESAFPPAATICGAAPLRRCAAIRHGAARVRLIRGRPRKFMLSCYYLRGAGSIALYPNPAKNLMCFSYLITHHDPTNLPRCRPPSPVSFWSRAVPEISVWLWLDRVALDGRSDSTQAPPSSV
jgi:hypothetical protein